jgi:predicted PurR-regulated permease PerM
MMSRIRRRTDNLDVIHACRTVYLRPFTLLLMTHPTKTVPLSDYFPPRWVSAFICAALISWILYSLREMVVLLVCGYAIAYSINPLLIRLEAHGIRRSLGVFILGFVTLLGVLFLTLTILPSLFFQASSLIQKLPEYSKIAQNKLVIIVDEIDTLVDSYMGVATAPGALGGHFVKDWIVNFDFSSIVSSNMISSFSWGLLGALLKGYSLTLTILNLLLLPFIVYYLSLDLKRLHYSVLVWIPKQARQKVRTIAHKIDRTISAFLKGQVTVALILSVLYVTGLGVLGIEQWFALGVISGLGSVVPYLGGIIGVTLATVMALATFGTVKSLLLVWGLYLGVQALEGTLITPRIVGDQVGLSPLLVILALFAGASLFGVLGVLFAIPVAASLRVLTLEVRNLSST